MKRVEYDINKSEYYFKVNKLTFFFSSKFNKTRFENGFIEYVSEETNKIKAKYVNWYNKKFKYVMNTRGEPLVDAGDYGIIQTQFSERMPVYILQNHWSFDGTWSGDMEVIALG